MKRLVASLALVLVAALCLSLPATAQQPQPWAAEQASDDAENRKILVMLRMPANHFRPNARYSGSYDDRAAQEARRRVAAQIARDNGLELLDGWPMPLIGVDCYVMLVPAGQSLDQAIERVSKHRMVAWSQLLQQYETLASPAPLDDPLLAAQPATAQWRLSDLHRVATGRGVTIAVIDSKVEVAHPDLAGQFVSSRDFLSNDRRIPAENHGTGVAGIIGAKRGNGVGIVGIAPGARLMALRACAERRRGEREVSTCDTLGLARALQFAIERGADIINMSLSGPRDRLLSSLVAVSVEKGVAVVAPFDPRRAAAGFPASEPGVIVVADGALPSLPERVFGAPGQDIPTTQTGGRWYLVNGSSFAAAHVAGLLALLREERRPANSIVRGTGGRIDACATLVRVTPDCNCECAIGRAAARSRD